MEKPIHIVPIVYLQEGIVSLQIFFPPKPGGQKAHDERGCAVLSNLLRRNSSVWAAVIRGPHDTYLVASRGNLLFKGRASPDTAHATCQRESLTRQATPCEDFRPNPHLPLTHTDFHLKEGHRAEEAESIPPGKNPAH